MPRGASKSKKGTGKGKGNKKWQPMLIREDAQQSLLSDSHSVNEDDFMLMEELAGQAHDPEAMEHLVPSLWRTRTTESQQQDCPNMQEISDACEDYVYTSDDRSGYSDCETSLDISGVSLGSGFHIGLVLTDGTGRYRVNEQAVESLLAPEVAERPAVVVSIAGAFRGGKSFLLDYFLRYLNADESARETGEWLGGQDKPLGGFAWFGGCERITTGIDIWTKHFPMTLPSGEEVVVILMDTQGSFDDQSSMRDCSMIFALSTLLSSVQIYNLSQKIKEDDLQHLQLFTEYAALGGGALQALALLVRDWSVPYEYAYGHAGGQHYLRDKLQVKAEQPPELREIRQRLAASFERLDCFLMPHPGLKAATDPAFNGKLADLTEEFKQALLELVPLMLAPENLRVKLVNGQPMKTRDLPVLLNVYLDEFNHQAPTPQTILSATVTAQWLAAASAARDALSGAAPRCAEPRRGLEARLRAARDALLAPLAALAARAASLPDTDNLATLTTALDKQIILYMDLNEIRITAAIDKAEKVFEEAVVALEDTCFHPTDLETASEDVRAKVAACYDKEVQGNGHDDPDRTLLMEEIDSKLLLYKAKNSDANQKAQRAAYEIYQNAMSRYLRPDPYCWHPGHLDEFHKEAQKNAMDHFFQSREGPNSHKKDKYLMKLEKSILNNYKSIHDKNELRNKTLLNNALKVFCEKMDQSLKGALKMSQSDLEEKLSVAFRTGCEEFKKNTSSFVGLNPHYIRLQTEMRDKYEHYRSKNQKNPSGAELAGGIVLTGAALVGSAAAIVTAPRIAIPAVAAVITAIVKK